MRPQDRGWSRALDKQMDFHKWCSSDAGRVYNFAYFTDILEKVTVDLVEEERNIQTTAIQLQGEVIETLWRADTLFVTSDMLHVLMQAAHDLPDDAQFDEEVLITPCGFCLFEEPITGQDRQGLNICVHGMMWKTVLGHSRMEETMEKMLVIYFLVDPNDVFAFNQGHVVSGPVVVGAEDQ